MNIPLFIAFSFWNPLLVVSFHEFSCVSQVLYKFSLAYDSYIFQFIVLLISPRFTSGFVPFDDLLVWQTHIMPPRRSRPRTAAGSLQLQTAVLQALSLPQLREICQTNGLSVTGTRATLTKRLKTRVSLGRTNVANRSIARIILHRRRLTRPLRNPLKASQTNKWPQ